jgi:hypothetical protein
MNQSSARQGPRELEESKTFLERCDLEAQQFIHDAAKMVVESAAQGAAVHVSQSFSGSSKTSAIVVCLVACPETLVLEVQAAVDRAVEETLGVFPVFSIT